MRVREAKQGGKPPCLHVVFYFVLNPKSFIVDLVGLGYHVVDLDFVGSDFEVFVVALGVDLDFDLDFFDLDFLGVFAVDFLGLLGFVVLGYSSSYSLFSMIYRKRWVACVSNYYRTCFYESQLYSIEDLFFKEIPRQIKNPITPKSKQKSHTPSGFQAV